MLEKERKKKSQNFTNLTIFQATHSRGGEGAKISMYHNFAAFKRTIFFNEILFLTENLSESIKMILIIKKKIGFKWKKKTIREPSYHNDLFKLK